MFNMEDTELLQFAEGSLSPIGNARSPLYSDSGISDENGSPYSQDSQSLPSPLQFIPGSSPDQVITIDTNDFEMLSQDDPMFSDELLATSPASDDSASEPSAAGESKLLLTC